MTVYYVDLVNGNDANNGTSFANRKKTLSSATASTGGGDEIRIMKSPDPFSLGQEATFTNKSLTVTLSSALTTTIYNDGPWTANTNVTASTDTTNRKEGSHSASLAIGAAFTTGKAAYRTLPSVLDLSAYEQVSFWIRTSSSVSANAFRLDLCSDTTGDTPVDSFTIPYGLSNNAWTCLTLNKGSALGASIQSIALTCLSDPGVATVLLDNIIACKASGASDCLTLNHVIGKNDGDWWAIRSIDGTTISLDTGGAITASGSGRGFSGTTQTTTIYAMLPIAPSALTTSNYQNFSGTAGSFGNTVNISGGWDSTDMSSQPAGAMTFIDGIHSSGVGWNNSSLRAFVNWSKLGQVRGSAIINFAAANNSFMDITSINLSSTNHLSASGMTTGTTMIRVKDFGSNCGIFLSGSLEDAVITDVVSKSSNLNSSPVFSTGTVGKGGATINGITVTNHSGSSSGSIALFGLSGRDSVRNLTATDCGNIGIGPAPVTYNVTATGNTYGVSLSTQKVYGLTTSDNVTGAINYVSSSGGRRAVIYDASLGEATKVSFTTFIAGVTVHRAGDYDTNISYLYMGTIEMETSVVPTGMSRAWKFSPTRATCTNATVALGNNEDFPIARVACKGGQANTFQFACRRTNTNLTCNLRVFGGRYPGVGSAGTDIVTSVNPAADTWQNFQISVTPSEDCVIEIFFECYHDGTTTYSAYVGGPMVVS